MITLLASLIGFLSSIFPEFMKIFKDKLDKKHELDILAAQIKMQKDKISGKLEQIDLSADIEETKSLYATYKTDIRFVDTLNGLVRPIIAYAFFILYAGIKVLTYLCLKNHDISYQIDILWSVDDQAIFAGIISFYFGNRAMSKLHNNIKSR